MKCERDIEKNGPTACTGQFCQPDSFVATRIAQNFPQEELNRRVLAIEERLKANSGSCNLQAAFNEMSMALSLKGVGS